MNYHQLLTWPRPLRWGLGLSGIVLIYLLGSIPGDYRPAAAGGGWAYFSNYLHQPLYAFVGLGFLVALRRRNEGWQDWLLAAGYAFGLGILDEIHQANVEGRSSSLWDLGSDALGAFGIAYLAFLTTQGDRWRSELPILFLLLALSLAWNCIPAFAPEQPLPFLR
jgi:VanZ family protein